MYYLSDYQAEFMFRRKPRKDKGRKRKWTKANEGRKEGQKILSSVNRTSEELRGWTNSMMRLKRMIDGNF